MYRDNFTGKPVDKVSDLLPAKNGEKCEECGAELLNHCLNCGAPICCPNCCYGPEPFPKWEKGEVKN